MSPTIQRGLAALTLTLLFAGACTSAADGPGEPAPAADGSASDPAPATAADVLVNVRVEAIALAAMGDAHDPTRDNVLRGRVVRTVYRGPNSDVDVAVGDGTIRTRTSIRPEPAPGDEVVLSFPVERTTVLEGDRPTWPRS
jgi:hypothetical protein